MRIVHLSRFKLGTVNGSYNALWSLACAQAERGHDVAIIRVGKAVAPADEEFAASRGVRLLGFPCPMWREFWTDRTGVLQKLIRDFQPDVAHLSYVRIPKFAYIARFLERAQLPYVISPHGGLLSDEMVRRKSRKLAYWHGIEKRVHLGAVAIHFVSSHEQRDYYATLGVARPLDVVIPNAVNLPRTLPKWKGHIDPTRPRLAYFGRYDVWHKGIDLTLAMLRALGTEGVRAEFHLHGRGFTREMSSLKKSFPEILIVDHGYHDAPEKYTLMADYDLYLQYSRFEVFGLSLAEAMAIGVPAVISENSDLAAELASQRAAIRIPMDPGAAATVVRGILERPGVLTDVSAKGREWVRSECNPSRVAEEMEQFYTRVLDVSRP
jgi:glycosyltransferase involved in cell wall biosynthesis